SARICDNLAYARFRIADMKRFKVFAWRVRWKNTQGSARVSFVCALLCRPSFNFGNRRKNIDLEFGCRLRFVLNAGIQKLSAEGGTETEEQTNQEASGNVHAAPGTILVLR